MPLIEVGAVAFALDPGHQDGPILVLSAEERARPVEATDGRGPSSLSDALALAGLMTGTRRILPGRLTASEKLELELLIQAAIRSRSGREVT